MHMIPILQLMALLTLANGAPVVAKKIFGSRFALPLDFGAAFLDGRPVFGPSKTFRGILVAVLAAAAAAPLMGLDPVIGLTAAGGAMTGDLFSSFVKRRLNLPSSSQALGLDQIPESLLPMLACRDALSLTTIDIVLGVGVFFAGELVLSRLLFHAHLRDEPY
jgi:hypothetical protein